MTGATGLIGRNLIKKLLSDGHNITALVRKTSNVSSFKGLNNLTLAYGNILDKESLKNSMVDCKVVYHLAAAVNVSEKQKRKMYALNVKGTENVLNAAIESKVKRFIYASTIAIYGKVNNEKITLIEENYPPHPISNYAKTKFMGENLVKDLCSKNKMDYVVLRPSKVYGPGDNSLLPLLKLAKKGLSFTIGKGDGITMPVYSTDVAEAFYLALNKKNKTYIIAGPDAMTKRKFVEALSKALKKNPRKLKLPAKPILLLARIVESTASILNINLPLSQKLNFFLASRLYSIDKAKKELGYYPKVGIDLMIKKTLDYYKEESLI